MVTVVALSDFHHGGRQYGWRDELEIPADQLQQWLGTGRVRLAQEHELDVRDILDAFAREHPVTDHDNPTRRLQ